jgi:hypothetical protein
MSTASGFPGTASPIVVGGITFTTETSSVRIVTGVTLTTETTSSARECGIQGYYACPQEVGAGCCPLGFRCEPNSCLPPVSLGPSSSDPVLGLTVGVITTPAACPGSDGFIVCASSIGGESNLSLPFLSYPKGLGFADSPPSANWRNCRWHHRRGPLDPGFDMDGDKIQEASAGASWRGYGGREACPD